MPKYLLTAPFYDGAALHKRGDVVELPEGKAPSRAVRLDEPEPETEPEPKPKAKPVVK